MRGTLLGTVIAAVLCSVGCGGGKNDNLVQVSGLLTWDDGTTPIPQAQVDFLPDGAGGLGASGFTDDAGKFDLTTKSSGDGAVPGKYKVVVKKRASTAAKGPGGGDPTKQMQEYVSKFGKKTTGFVQPKKVETELPEVYADPNTTRLIATVEAGAKIHLKLKKS
jgi:hypothetical protein